MGSAATEPKQPLFERLLSPLQVRYHILSPFVSESFESRRRALLRLLSLAHAERLDAAVLVGNLGQEYRGRQRRQLLNLADRLSTGTPVAAALEQTPGALSEDDVLVLQFAHQTGTISQAFDQLLDEKSNTLHSSFMRERLRESLCYFLGTFLCTIAVIVFLMIFIVPTLTELCNEFGLTQPSALQSLIAVSDGIAQRFPAFLLGVIGVIAMLWLASNKGWFKLSSITRRFGVRGYASNAELLRLLSISTDAGRPMPAALSTLARFHFDKATRQRLLLARNEVELGVDVWQSLADAKLISSNEAEGLSSLHDPHVRAWAMRQLATTKQDRIGRRSGRLSSLIPTIGVLSLAVVVAWLGVAMLQLLSSLVFFTA